MANLAVYLETVWTITEWQFVSALADVNVSAELYFGIQAPSA
jgi:hypothetical protein